MTPRETETILCIIEGVVTLLAGIIVLYTSIVPSRLLKLLAGFTCLIGILSIIIGASHL